MWRHGPFEIELEWTTRGWVYVTRDRKGVQQDGAPKTFGSEDEALRFALGRLPLLDSSPVPFGVIGEPWGAWDFGILYDSGDGSGILRHFDANDVYRVFTIPIPADVAATYPWIDWPYVARRTGQDDAEAIKQAGRGPDLRWRAYALDHVGRAYDHADLLDDPDAQEVLSTKDAKTKYDADVQDAMQAERAAGLREPQDNPPWSNRLLAEHGAQLAAMVGPRLMPVPAGGRARSVPKYAELGSGQYGVALPTYTPGVAIKLTTDPWEARFVLASFAMGSPPVGIVRYYGIAELFGAQHEERHVYAVWREQAESVHGFTDVEADAHELDDLDRARALTSTWMALCGDLYGLYSDLIGSDYAAVHEARAIAFGPPRPAVEREAERLMQWHHADLASATTRPHVPPAALPGKRRVKTSYEARITGFASYLRALELVALELEETTTAGMWVGQALRFYLVQGRIILPDMHGGNVGVVRRDEQNLYEPAAEGGVLVYVITDPGVAIFLDDTWDEASALTPANLPKLPRWRAAA